MKTSNLTGTWKLPEESQVGQAWCRLVPKSLALDSWTRPPSHKMPSFPQAALPHTGCSGGVWCDVTILIFSWP